MGPLKGLITIFYVLTITGVASVIILVSTAAAAFALRKFDMGRIGRNFRMAKPYYLYALIPEVLLLLGWAWAMAMPSTSSRSHEPPALICYAAILNKPVLLWMLLIDLFGQRSERPANASKSRKT